MQIAIIGTGYVGLVTGVCLAEVGHTVTCVDLEESKIRALNDGISPIYEPGIEGMIKRNREHERLSFTTSLDAALNGSEVVFVAVGTPETEDGSADLRAVEGVASEIGDKLTDDLLVVIKSTVPVGTSDRIYQLLREKQTAVRKKTRLSVASNPEFLKEGAAIADFMRPDRIVVGTEDEFAKELFRNIYRPFILDNPGKLVFMDRRSSELTKYAANAMLATRISFMNEMARLCEKVGADIDAVRRGIGFDPRIGPKFLFAGPGFGGSCFPKDVSALLKTGEQYNQTLRVLSAVDKANAEQKQFAADKILAYFPSVSGKRFAIWGLTFKPGTDDVRETPAKSIVESLLAAGAAVVCHDPQGKDNFAGLIGQHARLAYADDSYQAIDGVDALVLVTEWSEYKRPNWQKVRELMRGDVIFDFRNQYELAAVQEHGFHYECIGRFDSVNQKPVDKV